MKQIKQVNKDLTYQELKKMKGFEETTEAEAEKHIEVIKRLAKVLYYMYVNESQQKNNSL